MRRMDYPVPHRAGAGRGGGFLPRGVRGERPAAVRLAILLFVGFYYENRDVPDHQTYATMREAFENLLYPYRDPEKMF